MPLPCWRRTWLAAVGELAERIKNQQRKLADRVMRANARGMPRMDAVEYLISALAAYRALEPEVQKHTLSHYRGGRTGVPRRAAEK